MKQSIHVVYIITKLELGGAQKICLTLLNGLPNMGFETTLITSSQGALVDQISNKPNVILLDKLNRELKGLFSEMYCFYLLIQKLRILRNKHPNLIVHTHSTKAGLLGRWAAFFAGVKQRIHTIHGYGFHKHQPWFIRLPIIFLEWITSFITTQFICVSSEDVKTGITLFPSFTRRHTIIRAAIHWEQFYIPARHCADFPAKDTEPFIFGTIACLKKQKNIFDLLQAFAWVHSQHNQTKLEIIGDGILRNEIELWINQTKLTNVITMHGWQHTVTPIMLNWNAFVLSSLWEGLPCAIVEARLLKLPVLSYNTGGIHDVIMHGQNGLLFEQHDWINLAKHMLTISKKKSVHQALSSYKDNLQDFKYEAMLQQHVELYQSLHK